MGSAIGRRRHDLLERDRLLKLRNWIAGSELPILHCHRGDVLARRTVEMHVARHDHPPEARECEPSAAFAVLINRRGHRRRERLARRSRHALDADDEHRVLCLGANEIAGDANSRAARGAGGLDFHAR